jgi:hypothetical protein
MARWHDADGIPPPLFYIVLKAAAAAAGVGPSAAVFSERLTVHSFLISYQLRPVTKF